jgi:hypothetical protein
VIHPEWWIYNPGQIKLTLPSERMVKHTVGSDVYTVATTLTIIENVFKAFKVSDKKLKSWEIPTIKLRQIHFREKGRDFTVPDPEPQRVVDSEDSGELEF